MKPILITFFVLTTFPTCKKPEPYYPLSPEMRALATMKPGSFMVFEDSLHPGVRDSFWIYKYSDEIIKNDRDPKQVYTFDHINCQFTDNNTFIEFSTTGTTSKYNNLFCGYVDMQLRWEGFRSFVCNAPVQIGATLNNEKLTSHIDTITIKNKKYENVYLVESYAASNNYWKSYYNESEGLIKLEIKTASRHCVLEQLNSLIVK